MIKELVEKTRSYRSFKPDTEIEESVLLELVDVARKCSAAMNAQPLKYKLVTDKAERSALCSYPLGGQAWHKASSRGTRAVGLYRYLPRRRRCSTETDIPL